MTKRWEYRGLDPARDTERICELLGHAFGVTPEQSRLFISRGPIDSWRVMAPAGGVPDACAVFPRLGQFLGGRCVPMTGVAGVAVAPEARGGGCATIMMTEAIREMHAAGIPISVLYPATQPLYRRAGYEQAGYTFEHTVKLREIAVTKEDRALGVRKLEESDKPALERLYHDHAQRHDGWLDRRGYIWTRIHEPRGAATTGFIIEGDGGMIEGWLIFMRGASATGVTPRAIMCTDVQALTHRAARRLVALMADHASVIDEFKFNGGPVHALGPMLAEQCYGVTLVDHWMLRIVSLPTALEQRGYPKGLTGEVTIDVRDEHLPANNGRFHVRVEGGSGKVAPGGGAGPGAIALDIRDLAAIYTGFLSPYAAALMGRLDGPEAALNAAAAIFRGGPPEILDRF